MKNIIVSKSKLKDILKVNKEAHVQQYKEAKEKYIQAIIQYLSTQKDKVERTGVFDSIRFDRNMPTKPQSFEKDYDMALSMISYHTESTIALSKDEFINYIKDDWSWSRTFQMTTASYLT